MSQFFYIVSELNGFVLDISQAMQGGQLVNNPTNGMPSQLWRWDGSGRLVSKQGLYADIQGGKKNPGTPVIGWSGNDGLNQKWVYEGGFIKSSLNGFVMDVANENRNPGGSIITYPKNGKANQKWKIVPEGAWNAPPLYAPPSYGPPGVYGW